MQIGASVPRCEAIGETGGGLSRTAKQEENGNGKLDREF
jgi:hypothetical protein